MNRLFYILPLTLLLGACGSSSTPSATTVTTSTPVNTTTSGSGSNVSTGTNTTTASNPSNTTGISAPASGTSKDTSTSTTTTSNPGTSTANNPTTTAGPDNGTFGNTGAISTPGSTPISISTPVTTTPTDATTPSSPTNPGVTTSNPSGTTSSTPTPPVVVNRSTTGQYLSPTAAESEMLSLMNQVRAQGYTCNAVYYPPAAPLTWNSALGQSAQQYAEVMSSTHNFAHDGLDGSTPESRIKAAGYTSLSLYAENISEAANQTDAGIKAVMQRWLDSEDHCENIMDPKLKEVGIGYAADSTDAQYSYWVQDFGG